MKEKFQDYRGATIDSIIAQFSEKSLEEIAGILLDIIQMFAFDDQVIIMEFMKNAFKAREELGMLELEAEIKWKSEMISRKKEVLGRL